MAKKNIAKKVIAATTALGALCILVGAIALAFEANDSTLPDEPSAELPRDTDKPPRPGERSDRSLKTPSLPAGRDFSKGTSSMRAGLKNRDIQKHRPSINTDFRKHGLDHRADPTNLRMRRTSEMTPEERQQRRVERRERQRENLQRRIESLSERIEQAKADGSRSEQQIERMERSMERMQDRLQRLESDETEPQRPPHHQRSSHSSGYHPGRPPRSNDVERHYDHEANQHYERETSPPQHDDTGATTGEEEDPDEDE